jgi:hypothetical protein
MMSLEDATRRVVLHTLPGPGSFLGMLRPYQGVTAQVLRDLEEALHDCIPHLSAPSAPRDLSRALWSIHTLGRAWAVHPDGMLRRNGLVSEAERAQLTSFLDAFDYAVFCILEGAEVEEAFAELRRSERAGA